MEIWKRRSPSRDLKSFWSLRWCISHGLYVHIPSAFRFFHLFHYSIFYLNTFERFRCGHPHMVSFVFFAFFYRCAEKCKRCHCVNGRYGSRSIQFIIIIVDIWLYCVTTSMYIVLVYISDSSDTVTFRCVVGFGPFSDDTSTNPASHGAHCAAELSFGGELLVSLY